MGLAELTHETFASRIGERFAISEPAALEQANVGVAAHDPARRPFSLVFRGPPRPLLPQRIYRLEHAALGPLEISSSRSPATLAARATRPCSGTSLLLRGPSCMSTWTPCSPAARKPSRS
jgi:hypothetical protein